MIFKANEGPDRLMDPQSTDGKVSSLSMHEYASGLSRNGTRVVPGAQSTFWLGYESVAVMRVPTFDVTPPAPGEIRQILWRGRAGIVSYLLEPDERHPANAWLYVCTDRTYGLDKLAPAVRRNVRRGSKELRIEPVSSDQLFTHGVQAFCDTRRRVGLNDGTPAMFSRRIISRAKCSGHVFLGAWKDDKLAAFLSITEVEDWAEIESCFSMDCLLNLRPNDALMFKALSYYLVEKRCRLVSYGLSSLQAVSNEAGLHAFKTKVGFKARPVHRAFILHPFLRPFANRVTLWSINAMLRFKPGNRALKKAGGVLASVLGKELFVRTQAECG